MSFGKHETFHLRDGWLNKGLLAISENPSIFREKNAPVQLGIGRNMVRSLAFWMLATGLAERVKSEQRILVYRLTSFGHTVLEHDRYFEDEGTLWLIHYHLACSQAQATTWYWFFNHFTPSVFDKESFLKELHQWCIETFKSRNISYKTLERDFQVFVRTYVASDRKYSPEDSLVSPLSQLGLLYPNGKSSSYHFTQPIVDQIPPLVMLYVLLQESPGKQRTQSNLNLLQVLRAPMSVGRVFNLSAGAFIELSRRLEQKYPEYKVRFVRTGGLDQLILPSVALDDVLRTYYQQRVTNEK